MRGMDRYRYLFTMVATLLVAAGCWRGVAAGELAGRVAFTDPRNPPPWTDLHPAARRDYDLGLAIFNTPWLVAGQADAARRDGLGPLFVQPSCDACHNNGGRGQSPPAPGQLSTSFVMQLGGAMTGYGHVLNTQAIAGHVPEGRVTVTWRRRTGRYPDGQRWTLREPGYALRDLGAGPLPATTVLKPRIGPALFGAGLIDAVSQPAVDAIRLAQPESVRGSAGGRFGWQGDSISMVDQVAVAFAREMGLTSEQEPRDDCTPSQASCLQAQQGGEPEVSGQFFHAVTTFQFMLAAPARGALPGNVTEAQGAALFEKVGCAACHVPRLPVPREQEAILIDPYTDLLRHDLGAGLADRTVAGTVVQSRWRTAPLWGLAEAVQPGRAGLLHDGRAGTIEEAILWHEGQGAAARGNFMALDAGTRRQLLDWLATL
jgi:CxxC motif-containing protein (DUF1111 family)